MKRVVVMFACLFMTLAWAEAQKIAVNEVDKFTGIKRLETSYKRIYMRGLPTEKISVAFGMVDSLPYLKIRLDHYDYTSVDQGADVIFLDSEGKTYNLTNSFYESPTSVIGTTGSVWRTVLTLMGDLTFIGKQVTGIRIYSTRGYIDFDISEAGNAKLQKTYKVFQKAMPK